MGITVSDIRHGSSPKFFLDNLSIKQHISSDDPSILIIYGEEYFPFITGSCRDLAAVLAAAKVENELIPIPGIGH
jgi:hypothetical protein